MYPDFAVFFRNTALQSFGVSAYAFKPAPCLAKKSLQNYLIIGAYACAHSPCSAPKFTRNTLQSFSVIFALCSFAVSAYGSGDKTQSDEKILAKLYLIQFGNTALQSLGISAYSFNDQTQ